MLIERLLIEGDTIMANERPAQVEEADAEDSGYPAKVEAWQDGEGTNLPDNPAYAVPPVPQDEAKKAAKEQKAQR